MRELRSGGIQRLIQQDLLRRIRDVIVAADDVRDGHVDVVDHHRQMVGGVAIGAQNHERLDVLVVELDRAVYQVGKRGLAVRAL